MRVRGTCRVHPKTHLCVCLGQSRLCTRRRPLLRLGRGVGSRLCLSEELLTRTLELVSMASRRSLCLRSGCGTLPLARGERLFCRGLRLSLELLEPCHEPLTICIRTRGGVGERARMRVVRFARAPRRFSRLACARALGLCERCGERLAQGLRAARALVA
jgi:hypothetical protein